MFFRRKKLLSRLIAITLATTLLPLLVGGLYFIHENRQQLLLATEQRLSLEARLKQDVIEKKLFDPLHQIVMELESARSPVATGRARQLFARYPELDSNLIFLSEVQSIQPFLESVWLRGGTLGTLPDSLKRELARRAAARGEPGWLTYCPQPGSAYLVGVLRTADGVPMLFGLDLPRFLSRIARASGQETFTVLDVANRTLIFSTSPVLKKLRAESLLQLEGFAGESDTRAGIFRPKGAEEVVLGSSRLTDGVNWLVFADVPLRKALAPIGAMQFNFVAILLFGIFLTVLGTTYYWKKIAGPLDRFARSATEIARGDFNQRIEIDSDDEIGRLAKIFNYMVIELRRLNRLNLNKIISEKNKTQTIIRNIADGVIVTDNENRIITVNSAVERWFHVKEKDLINQPIEKFLDVPELSQMLQDIRETDLEGTFTREMSITLPHETKPRVFQARATKIKGEEDSEVGVVIVLRDITREKEIDRMKTELVSMVAHELKSPLASISGFAELLLLPDESPEAIQEYASVIRNEANRLADLVNKFLDITKIEAGRIDFHPTELPVSVVLNGVLHVASAEAQKKNITLDVEVQREDLTLHADEKMISEVLLNLLSNAIKYSPENTRVLLRFFENENGVVLQVRDQGYGIPPEHLPRIFDKFYRIKTDPRVQEERGTGLGLSLVKEIVELHGGRINVESEPGKGTTFTIVFPKAKKKLSWKP